MKQQKSKIQNRKKQISKQLKKMKPKKNSVAFYLSVILVIFIIVAFVYMYIEKKEPEVTESPTTPDATPTEDITTLPPEDDPDDDSKETSSNLYQTLCIIFLTLGSTLSVYTLTNIMMKIMGGTSSKKTNNLDDMSKQTQVQRSPNAQTIQNKNLIVEYSSSGAKIRKFIHHFFFLCISVTYIVLSFLRDQLDPSKQTSEELVVTFQVTSIIFLLLYVIQNVLP